MGKIVQYEHHGKVVFVDEVLMGKHRECCLCFRCASFKPEDRENNCPRANELFAFVVRNDMVTPVFECPVFVEAKKPEQ